MTYDIDDYLGAGAVSNNAADFSRSLLGLADYATQGMEKVIRKACIDLYRGVVEKTPVDTGRAKANWQLSTSHSETTRDNPDGYSFSEIQSMVEGEISDFNFTLHDGTVTIYNNLEYIEDLENGTSQQAPYGMVALSLAEFTNHFNQALAGLEGLNPI